MSTSNSSSDVTESTDVESGRNIKRILKDKKKIFDKLNDVKTLKVIYRFCVSFALLVIIGLAIYITVRLAEPEGLFFLSKKNQGKKISKF